MGAVMNRELRSRLISELQHAQLAWQTSPRHDVASRLSVRWFPVANLTAARIQIGLSIDGWWVVPGSQSVTEFTPGTPCVFLLPVLEVSLDGANRALLEGLQQAGLSGDFIALFPFEAVVVCGLESLSQQWARLALIWAEELPASDKLRCALELARTRGPTQEIRHAAQRLIARKWTRAGK
jgi:hypothetical protein